MVMRGDRVIKIRGSQHVDGLCLGLTINRQGEVICVCQTDDGEYFVATPQALKTKLTEPMVPSKA